MVVSIDIIHIFKYPVDQVSNVHLTKYPTEKETKVVRIETKEHRIDYKKGEDYRRRWAFCCNIVPQILRINNVLNVKELIFEEESWLNLRTKSLLVESRNITFSHYAQFKEKTYFSPASENPNWTKFEQHGTVIVSHLGPFNKLLEAFAKKSLTYGGMKALKVMEEILQERSTFSRGNASKNTC